jgi:hypothetical protein
LQQPANSAISVFVKAQELVGIGQDAEATPVTYGHLHALFGVLFTERWFLVFSLTRTCQINQETRPSARG